MQTKIETWGDFKKHVEENLQSRGYENINAIRLRFIDWCNIAPDVEIDFDANRQMGITEGY